MKKIYALVLIIAAGGTSLHAIQTRISPILAGLITGGIAGTYTGNITSQHIANEEYAKAVALTAPLIVIERAAQRSVIQQAQSHALDILHTIMHKLQNSNALTGIYTPHSFHPRLNFLPVFAVGAYYFHMGTVAICTGPAYTRYVLDVKKPSPATVNEPKTK